ncbi:MAG TPA: zinc ribbon domain-containing protein [Ktedonobacteraceae bacterium]
MQSLIGQYECNHRSALGLDYFTARLDRLTLYASGRFALVTQEKSRAIHALKNLAAGDQVSTEAPEKKAEGSYSSQGDILFLSFDSGEQERATIQETGLLFGKDFFEKVSENTFVPNAQRLKSNMDDIAKGLKIAGAIGGTVLKAAKTIQDNLQPAQPTQNQPGSAQPAPAQSSWPAQNSAPAQSAQNQASWPAQNPTPAQPAAPAPQQATAEAFFYCDQCGSPVRLGKKFCNKCGAPQS